MKKIIYTSNYDSIKTEKNISKNLSSEVLTNYDCELYTIAARLRMDADEEKKYLKEKQNKIKNCTI